MTSTRSTDLASKQSLRFLACLDHPAAFGFAGWATAWYILVADMVTIDQVRRVAMSLPRTEEHLIRGRVKFRVGKIVYAAFSRDANSLGFAFPREWRAALIEAEPDKFHMPEPADVRYNWVCVRRDAIDQAEMRKLITEAWRMVVPKSVAAGHLGPSRDARGSSRRRTRRPARRVRPAVRR